MIIQILKNLHNQDLKLSNRKNTRKFLKGSSRNRTNVFRGLDMIGLLRNGYKNKAFGPDNSKSHCKCEKFNFTTVVIKITRTPAVAHGLFRNCQKITAVVYGSKNFSLRSTSKFHLYLIKTFEKIIFQIKKNNSFLRVRNLCDYLPL